MSTYEAHYAAVMNEIIAAFDGVSREGGVSISESWVVDNYGTDEERAEARASDTDTCWQEVPARDIAFGYSCLSFFDEIGFRYHMPAYMAWSMKYYRAARTEAEFDALSEVEQESMSAERTISALTLNDRPSHEKYAQFKKELGFTSESPTFDAMREYHLLRFKFFTRGQSAAIAHFLQFLAIRHGERDAAEALFRYWKDYL